MASGIQFEGKRFVNAGLERLPHSQTRKSSKEQEARSKKQEATRRKKEARNKKPEARNQKQETGPQTRKQEIIGQFRFFVGCFDNY